MKFTEFVLPRAAAAAFVVVVVTSTCDHRGQWWSDSVEAVLAMSISRDSVAAATSRREDGCCVVELFGLKTDAQYRDCTASMASFVCARSFCAYTQVRCMHKNFKEELTLSRNACSGIIVPQNLRLFSRHGQLW